MVGEKLDTVVAVCTVFHILLALFWSTPEDCFLTIFEGWCDLFWSTTCKPKQQVSLPGTLCVCSRALMCNMPFLFLLLQWLLSTCWDSTAIRLAFWVAKWAQWSLPASLERMHKRKVLFHYVRLLDIWWVCHHSITWLM